MRSVTDARRELLDARIHIRTRAYTHRVQLLHEIGNILSAVLNQPHSANVLRLQHQVPLIPTGMLDVSLLVTFVFCTTRI